ncbi:CIR protein [Plasmodium chabaudi adami]|uniref:CIR protein n=1 Tax=Plasmodium chabaudi adami TaxID=5826 RepID=A0A1D3L8Q0_PLACE|nr:CIR protein [Plasmodium chabaudi adami]
MTIYSLKTKFHCTGPQWSADQFVNGENIDLERINEQPGFYEYCPRNKPCQNNMQGNINGFKEANLRHMNEFYKLLNHICKTIGYHKFNYTKFTNLLQNSTNSFNQYMFLYQNVEAQNRKKEKNNETKGDQIKQNSQPQSSVAQTPSPPAETGASSSIPDNGSDTLESKDKVVGDAQNKSNPKGSEQTDPGSDTGNKTNLQSNSSSYTPISGTNQGGGSGDGFIGAQNDKIGSGDGSIGGQDTIDSVSGIPDLSVTSSTRDIPTTSPFGMNLNVATYLVNAIASFETIKKRIAEATDTIKNLYSTSLSNLETTYDKSSSFLKDIIDNISSQPEKADTSAKSGNNQYERHTLHYRHKILRSKLTHRNCFRTHLETEFNQTDQGGSQKSLTSPVIKSENSVTKVKGSETTGIGDIHLLKEYKQIGISIIVILIPIILAIVYKYLSFGWRKELKRKQNMKKVINSIGGKRSMQIIIKSVDTKKMTNPVINPVSGKKYHY